MAPPPLQPPRLAFLIYEARHKSHSHPAHTETPTRPQAKGPHHWEWTRPRMVGLCQWLTHSAGLPKERPTPL